MELMAYGISKGILRTTVTLGFYISDISYPDYHISSISAYETESFY